MKKQNAKQVARSVASKYSNRLNMATHRYMELTGKLRKSSRGFKREMIQTFKEQEALVSLVASEGVLFEDDHCYDVYPEEVTLSEAFCEAQKEMLSLLQGYRCPVQSILIEQEIFFGSAECQIGKAIGIPSWLRNYEGLSKVPGPLMRKIREYVDDAEDVKRRLCDAESRIVKLQEMFNKAIDAYKPKRDDEAASTRNTRVVQALGFSKGTGSKKKPIDHTAAYVNYVKMVRHEGKSRKNAIDTIKKDYGYNSEDAAIPGGT